MSGMRFYKPLVALAVAAAFLIGAALAPVLAQDPKAKQDPPKANPDQADPGPKAKAPNRGSALPKTPAEREKTLSDLYALLATADDEETAKAITDAIERVWLHSGSATIDLLMERSIKAMSREEGRPGAEAARLASWSWRPTSPEAWNRRAYVHFVHKDTERALGDLQARPRARPQSFQGARRPRPDPARDRPEEAGAQGVPPAAGHPPLLVGCQGGRRGARARGRRSGHLSAVALGRPHVPTKPLTTRGLPPIRRVIPVATPAGLAKGRRHAAGVDGWRC